MPIDISTSREGDTVSYKNLSLRSYSGTVTRRDGQWTWVQWNRPQALPVSVKEWEPNLITMHERGKDNA